MLGKKVINTNIYSPDTLTLHTISPHGQNEKKVSWNNKRFEN